jgi:hypothetical protein
VALRQFDAVIGDSHHPDHMGEEFDLACAFEESILYQALLCFALISGLLVFGLLQFFHQVTFAVAMQPGLIAVLAKFGGDVIPVQLEAGIDKKARKTTAYDANDKQYGCNPVLHGAKIAAPLFLTSANSIFFVRLSFDRFPTKKPCL